MPHADGARAWRRRCLRHSDIIDGVCSGPARDVRMAADRSCVRGLADLALHYATPTGGGTAGSQGRAREGGTRARGVRGRAHVLLVLVPERDTISRGLGVGAEMFGLRWQGGGKEGKAAGVGKAVRRRERLSVPHQRATAQASESF